MIFVTVGMQLPFDRLIKSVLSWARTHDDKDIIFQVGPGGYTDPEYQFFESLDPEQFACYFSQADLIISHAGMGTIIQALESAKPLIIMPRRAVYREHRNDHQLYTAERFSQYPNIITAGNDDELSSAIEYFSRCTIALHFESHAENGLVDYIRSYIDSELPVERERERKITRRFV
jgi:UDP-N-acetylglucosamine transferase subunit ALG13